MRNQKVPELIEFVHSNKEVRPNGIVKGVGPHIGCVLARRVRVRGVDGRFQSAISIGWSQVNRAMGDEFNKESAVKLARKRAMGIAYLPVPSKTAPVYDRMMDRAERYFKSNDWA